jgi:hypothetical protein
MEEFEMCVENEINSQILFNSEDPEKQARELRKVLIIMGMDVAVDLQDPIIV